MQCSHVHHIAIVDGETKHRAHGEASQHQKAQMLGRPIQIVVEEMLSEAAWNECRIVGVQQRGENDLFEPIVVIRPEYIDLGPYS